MFRNFLLKMPQMVISELQAVSCCSHEYSLSVGRRKRTSWPSTKRVTWMKLFSCIRFGKCGESQAGFCWTFSVVVCSAYQKLLHFAKETLVSTTIQQQSWTWTPGVIRLHRSPCRGGLLLAKYLHCFWPHKPWKSLYTLARIKLNTMLLNNMLNDVKLNSPVRLWIYHCTSILLACRLFILNKQEKE